MVYITHVHLSGGNSVQHIEQVQWRDPGNAETGKCSTQLMVNWIDKGGSAWVQGPAGDVEVVVVRTVPPYLKTKPNKTHADNLLWLPRF
ncbi:DUF3892 domain-containing protein [Corallococcus llansteffanensis]|uniref:DUF3892 domain-containing protein n=1 Tax=Corallococcus llansteffanensis TaxID=2316731 RepID=A0A3A8PT38_9BACT|nr:DUF3892 domain-containing protein [Corallococcus llansteffanensis]